MKKSYVQKIKSKLKFDRTSVFKNKLPVVFLYVFKNNLK